MTGGATPPSSSRRNWTNRSRQGTHAPDRASGFLDEVTPAGAPVPRRLILAGLGNVGRSFLRVLESQAALLRERYGREFIVVGAAASGGTAFDPGGLDAGAVLAVK